MFDPQILSKTGMNRNGTHRLDVGYPAALGTPYSRVHGAAMQYLPPKSGEALCFSFLHPYSNDTDPREHMGKRRKKYVNLTCICMRLCRSSFPNVEIWVLRFICCTRINQIVVSDLPCGFCFVFCFVLEDHRIEGVIGTGNGVMGKIVVFHSLI